MKINKNKSLKKKTVVITLFLMALVSVAAFYYVRSTDSNQENSDKGSNVDLNAPTDEQKKAGEEIKKQSIDADSSQSSSDSNKSNSTKAVQVTITSLDVQSFGSASIRAEIDAVVNSGTCTLVLSKEGATTVTKTSSVQASANMSGCGAFDISNVQKGIWSATVTFANDTLSGSTTQKVTIQ